MKRLAALVLVTIAWFGSVSAAEPVAPTSDGVAPMLARLESGQPVRLVAFGDSITGVYYHTGGRRAWCDLVGLALQRLYPQARIELINAGISGNTTADALARIDADVLRHEPNLVFVMFGMNDTARLPAADFRANLRQIVERLRQRGATVVLATPNHVSAGDANRPPWKVADYAQIVREVGRELNVPVADPHRVFQSVQSVDHRAWLRLMSDAIHPNLRGHRLLAEEMVLALTGRRVPLTDLPPLVPGLPRLLGQLQAGETVRVVAMKPFDTLIGPAIRKRFPGAKVEVTAWDAAGKSLVAIEEQAKALGWMKYKEQPTLPRPDLFVLAVPANALAVDDDQFFHSYTWIMNWSLSFGTPGWNSLVILPSVAEPEQTPAERTAEDLALEVIQGQDLPWLRRTPGDRTPPADLLDQALARLLNTP